VAAVIHDAEGRIFATQRGYGDMAGGWEFPGGKIEAGETAQQALHREIGEELDTDITIEELLDAETLNRQAQNSLNNARADYQRSRAVYLLKSR